MRLLALAALVLLTVPSVIGSTTPYPKGGTMTLTGSGDARVAHAFTVRMHFVAEQALDEVKAQMRVPNGMTVVSSPTVPSHLEAGQTLDLAWTLRADKAMIARISGFVTSKSSSIEESLFVFSSADASDVDWASTVRALVPIGGVTQVPQGDGVRVTAQYSLAKHPWSDQVKTELTLFLKDQDDVTVVGSAGTQRTATVLLPATGSHSVQVFLQLRATVEWHATGTTTYSPKICVGTFEASASGPASLQPCLTDAASTSASSTQTASGQAPTTAVLAVLFLTAIRRRR